MTAPLSPPTPPRPDLPSWTRRSGTAPGSIATVAVIVVAAGSGTRLRNTEPKAFVLLSGRSLLDHALDSIFGMHETVQIVVVAPGDRLADAHAIAAQASARNAQPTAAMTVVAGGRTRQDSVDAGMNALDLSIEVVLVHDAARALTPASLCDAVVDAVRSTGHGIIPGLPVVDTIKRIAPSGAVLGTVDRSDLSAVQTPQGFPRTLLSEARAWAVRNGRFEAFTDDAALVADAGHPVSVIPGHRLAFKITTPEDLERAELILQAATPHSPVMPRIGMGLDVHAYADDDNTELWLAGLFWPGETGLSGHSDGDVAAHAICDALLGAAGLGDIGSIFGTADPRFSKAHGEVFLTETVRLVRAAGYLVGNVSVQIIGNRPRFSARRGEAETLLGGILSAPINIAATTTDALGFTGRGEGVAATATALLYPVPSTVPSQAPDLNWEA